MSIRRFSSPKRWYNLNSFLPSPEWISPTYLAMVLSQAEEEGYSVFVVRPLDGTATENMETQSIRSILPESQADLVALELGEPEGRTSGGVSIAATR
jgi:Ataxin-3